MLSAVLLGAALFAAAASTLRGLLFVWRTARDSASWPSAKARIEKRRIATPWLSLLMRLFGHHPTLRYRYTADNAEFVSRRIAFGSPSKSDMARIRTPLFHGEEATIYYDPEEPGRATLIAGPVSETLMVRFVLLMAFLMAAGAVLLAVGFLL